MRKIMILSLLALLFSIACTEEEPKVEELTFADIEQEFNFTKPLTEISKKFILEKFGSIEDYRNHLIQYGEAIERKLSSSKREYYIYLITPDQQGTCPCKDDEYILDASENDHWYDWDLPYSCRSGACTTCMAKKWAGSGTWDQSDQSILDDDQIDAGWVITCSAYPTSSGDLLTHQEEEFWNTYHN